MSSQISSNDLSAEEEGENELTPTKAIFPKKSPDEEERILWARIMELRRRKKMAQSSTSSADAYNQNENETNDDGCSSKSVDDDGQQHLLKAILKRMNVSEEKQQQNEAETKILAEKDIHLQKEQQKQKTFIDQLLSTDQQKFEQKCEQSEKFLLEKLIQLEKEQQKQKTFIDQLLSTDQQKFAMFEQQVKHLQNDQKIFLERMSEWEKKQEEKWTKEMFDQQIKQLQNEQKAFFGKWEKKQEEKWTKALAAQLEPILDRMGKMEEKQQQKYEESEKSFNDQFSQLHNEQKTLLGKISDLEKQHQMALAQQMKTNSEATVNANANKAKDTEEQHKKNLQIRVKFNFWDVNACHNDLTISGPTRTMVQRKGSGNAWWRTVFARYSILSSAAVFSNIFYFELNVKNLEYGIFFGFAVKHQTPLNDMIRSRTGTYAYEYDGNFYINGSKKDGNETFGDGAIVGCGVNFFNDQVFFTKNGHRIDVPNDFLLHSSPSADSLFPFVSLAIPNDKIDANFGPEFLFDLSSLC